MSPRACGITVNVNLPRQSKIAKRLIFVILDNGDKSRRVSCQRTKDRITVQQ